jgi:ribonuclease-3
LGVITHQSSSKSFDVLWRLGSTKKSPRQIQIAKFLKKSFGVRPRNLNHYELALRHSSVAVKDDSGVKNSNERLEFLGDAILDAVLADYLYQRFVDKTEGELTKMKAKIVNRKTLNEIGKSLDIPEHLDLSLGGQEMHPSIVGNAFEAIIGAIYLDRGDEYTARRMLRIFQVFEIDQIVHKTTDFKSELHEWCQKERVTLKFRVIEEVQDGGSTRYTIEVLVDNKVMGSGKGKSKKGAEQLAARAACKKLFGN